MKFRKKPVVIEAVQFTGEQPWPEGVYASSNPRERDTPVCWTLEGPLHVSVGDWIIRGVRGEFYPCKPDILEHHLKCMAEKSAEIERLARYMNSDEVLVKFHAMRAERDAALEARDNYMASVGKLAGDLLAADIEIEGLREAGASLVRWFDGDGKVYSPPLNERIEAMRAALSHAPSAAPTTKDEE